ncbi:MAG: hypothetical protein PVS2B3_09850 [Steroidobacteraceae bacterium]
MRNRQRGVTAIGWLFLLTPIAIVGYAGMRLAPLYLNYMKVTRALEQVANDYKDGGGDPVSIRSVVDKHFEIDMVEFPTIKDLKITRDGAGWLVQMAYDDEAPFVSNISLHVTFDKKVHTGGAGGGG